MKIAKSPTPVDVERIYKKYVEKKLTDDDIKIIKKETLLNEQINFIINKISEISFFGNWYDWCKEQLVSLIVGKYKPAKPKVEQLMEAKRTQPVFSKTGKFLYKKSKSQKWNVRQKEFVKNFEKSGLNLKGVTKLYNIKFKKPRTLSSIKYGREETK